MHERKADLLQSPRMAIQPSAHPRLGANSKRKYFNGVGKHVKMRSRLSENGETCKHKWTNRKFQLNNVVVKNVDVNKLAKEG